MGFATFFTYFIPKSKQGAEDGFFLGIALKNAALAVAAFALLDEITTMTFSNLAMLAVAFAAMLPLVRVTRAFIAMHSDAHIEEHLIKSAAAIGGLLGPATLLLAETFSCYTSENKDNFDLETDRRVGGRQHLFHCCGGMHSHSGCICSRRIDRFEVVMLGYSLLCSSAGSWEAAGGRGSFEGFGAPWRRTVVHCTGTWRAAKGGAS